MIPDDGVDDGTLDCWRRLPPDTKDSIPFDVIDELMLVVTASDTNDRVVTVTETVSSIVVNVLDCSISSGGNRLNVVMPPV